MRAVRLRNGRLLVPVPLYGPGVHVDSMREIGRWHPEYRRWMRTPGAVIDEPDYTDVPFERFLLERSDDTVDLIRTAVLSLPGTSVVLDAMPPQPAPKGSLWRRLHRRRRSPEPAKPPWGTEIRFGTPGDPEAHDDGQRATLAVEVRFGSDDWLKTLDVSRAISAALDAAHIKWRVVVSPDDLVALGPIEVDETLRIRRNDETTPRRQA